MVFRDDSLCGIWGKTRLDLSQCGDSLGKRKRVNSSRWLDTKIDMADLQAILLRELHL
jgi:hypothetical protein